MFKLVTQAYENAKDRKIECRQVHHTLLESFFTAKSEMHSFFGDYFEHHSVLKLKTILSQMAFEFANCPIYLNSEYFYRDHRVERLNELYSTLALLYPTHASNIKSIITIITQLKETNQNPLLEAIEKDVDLKRVTITLINPDYSNELLEMAEQLKLPIEISALRKSNIFGERSTNILIGCAKYFPLKVFCSPQAKQQKLYRFAWFRDEIPKMPEILGSRIGSGTPSLYIKKEALIPNTVNLIEASNNDYHFDENNFDFHQNLIRSLGHREDELVKAKVVLLKGNKFVFLAEEEDSSYMCVINVDQEQFSIAKVKASEFDKNIGLLLRVRGTGDFIQDTANTILGSKANALRGKQSKWKKALKEKINQTGIERLSQILKSEGCSTGHTYNIKNWVSARFIKPENKNDFTILLSAIGLGDEARDIALDMLLIKRAHIQAGHRISKLLIDLIKKDENVSTIFTDGYKIYRLDDKFGNRIGIYMFDKILEKTFDVPSTMIGLPKEIELLYG